MDMLARLEGIGALRATPRPLVQGLCPAQQVMAAEEAMSAELERRASLRRTQDLFEASCYLEEEGIL